MKKMTRLIGTIVFILPVIITACRGERITNLDSNPEFSFMRGRQFKAVRDFVVMKYTASDQEFKLHIPGTSGVPELQNILQQLPFEYEGAIVYGVLKKGSVFKIVHILRHANVEYNQIDYSAMVVSDGPFKDKIM